MDNLIKNDLYDLNFSETFDISNAQEQNVDLSLDKSVINSSTITGTVLDSAGVPVEGATIKLFDSFGNPYMHTVTNNLGNYTFSNLNSGTYSITCVKEGIVITVKENIYLQEKDVVTHNFQVTYNETLNLCCIAGHVSSLDEKSVPIANAVVTLLNAETRQAITSTISASDGEYVFYDIADGEYLLVANKMGYNSSIATLVKAINNTIVNTDIKLSVNPVENLGTISGIISNNNIAISNAFVGLYKILDNNEEVLISTTKTNANGLYMFGKVEGGKYRVKAKLNNDN